MAKKPDSKRSAHVRDLQNAIRGGQEVRRALAEAKDSSPARSHRPLVRWLLDRPHISRGFFPPVEPVSLVDMHVGRLIVADLPAELSWSTAFIVERLDQVSRFIALKTDFESAFLGGRYDLAAAALNEVSQDFGWSVWLVKQRLMLEQTANGLDAHKAATARIREAATDGSLVGYLTHFISLRNEPAMTLQRFSLETQSMLAASGLPTIYSTYIRHHLLPHLPLSVEEAAGVIAFEHTSSLIDLYQATVFGVLRLVASEGYRISDVVSVSLERLARFDDPRLNGCLALADAGYPSPALSIDEAMSAYSSGQFGEAAAKAHAYLLDAPGDIDALAIGARAMAFCHDEFESASPAQWLMTRLGLVLRSHLDWQAFFGDVAKWAANADGAGWASVAFGLLEVEKHEGLLPPSDGRAALLPLLSTTGTPVLQDAALFWVDAGRALPASWHRNRYIEEHPDNQQRDVVATIRLRTADSMRRVLETTQASHEAVRRVGIRAVPRLMLAAGEVLNAMDYVVSMCVEDRAWNELFPIREIAEQLKAIPLQQRRGNISVPILFDLYWNYVDRSLESERAYSLLDVIDSVGMDRVSQLTTLEDRFQKSRLIHLLRYVATENVLDRTDTLENSIAVIEERLAICHALVRLNPAQVDAYEDEIKELLKRLIIKKGLQEFDESKIYVDVEGLRASLSSELRDGYARYQALRRLSDDLDPDLELRELVARITSEVTGKTVVLTLPRSGATQEFSNLLQRVEDQYFSSPEHGVDKYLSVRIRHGTFEAHLRRPIEDARLITEREAGSERYRSNDYWLNLVASYNAGAKSQVAALLESFSREYDEVLTTMRSWLQLKSTDESPGMFRCRSSGPDARVLASVIPLEAPVETFVASALDWMGGRLDHDLEAVRARLETEGKTRTAELLERLSSDISELRESGVDTGPMRNAIASATTDLQFAFGRILSWLHRDAGAVSGEFSVENAIDIGQETMRRTRRAQFVVTKDIVLEQEIRFGGRKFKALVELLCLLFSNAITHSQLDASPAAHAQIRFDGNELTIKVANPVAPGVCSPANLAKLDQIRQRLEGEPAKASASTEGRSGLIKLWRILNDDLRAAPHLLFGFQNDGLVFSVEIQCYPRVRAV